MITLSMNIKTWEKIESIFDLALSKPMEQQEDFVKEQTQGDNMVYSQVMNMLKAHDNFFMDETPVIVSNPNEFCGQELSSLAHFKIIKKIATGGMGRVYLAQSMNTDVEIFVALKTIRVELVNEDLEKRFFNEKKILSKLKHKNIASLIDAGVSENKIPYIATEWVEGHLLAEYCQNQQLSIKKRLEMFQQICSAVSFAHNKLIIHRDLKPDNIMVDANNQVKLLDFGIAKIVDDNQNIQTQTQIFTPDYAAPEQINGELCSVTTDVYSLGIILFEMLTNSKRFNMVGLTISQKIQLVCRPKPVDLSIITATTKLPYSLNHVKGALINIINKATHVDQNRRYESVAELSRDIENYISKRPVSAIKDSLFYKSKMFLLRHKLASVLTSLFIVSIVIGLYKNQQQIDLKLKEAQKSVVMLNFFNSVLESSTPAYGGSFNMTVKDMFETGIANFDFDALDDSYAKAEIAARISLIYSQLRKAEKAKFYNDMALDYYANNLNTIENISAYVQYASREPRDLIFDGKYDQALEKIDTILKTVKGYTVNDNPMTLINIYLARIHASLWDKRDIQKSVLYFDRAQKLARKNQNYGYLGEVEFYKSELYTDIKSKEEILGYLQGAEKYFKLSKDAEGRQNLPIVMASNASLLSEMGKLQEADKVFEESMVFHQEIFGRDNFSTLVNRAQNFLIMGNANAAIPVLNKAEELFDFEKRSKNVDYYAFLLYKASALTELKKHEQAGLLYQEVMTFMRNLLPEDHYIIKVVFNFQAHLFLQSQNLEGITLAQSQLEKSAQNMDGLEDLLKISILINLGNIYIFQENWQQAIKHFEKANQITNGQEEKYSQGWLFWQLKTALAFVQIKLNDNNPDLLIQSFNSAKQQLLAKVSEDEWYNNFYQLNK